METLILICLLIVIALLVYDKLPLHRNYTLKEEKNDIQFRMSFFYFSIAFNLLPENLFTITAIAASPVILAAVPKLS